MASKRKVTITVDDGLVNELEHTGNVSAQLNEAGWALLERRRRADRLAALLDQFEATDRPLLADPAEDTRNGRG